MGGRSAKPIPPCRAGLDGFCRVYHRAALAQTRWLSPSYGLKSNRPLLQPARNLADQLVRLGQQPSHRQERVELAGIVDVNDVIAGVLQPPRKFLALVMERIG